jgi:hypothetical protein
MSNLPRNCKSLAKVSSIFRSLPSLTHSWKRRWQVWYGGNLSGKSRHRAPERNIQSTPFITSRSDLRGLPRVVTADGLSNNGSIKDHCSSVNSSRRAISEVYQTIFEMASKQNRISDNKKPEEIKICSRARHFCLQASALKTILRRVFIEILNNRCLSYKKNTKRRIPNRNPPF